MKRYSIDRIYKNAELELQHACMELRDDGEWVKCEDVAVEIERLEKENRSLKRQVIGYFRALQASGKPKPVYDEDIERELDEDYTVGMDGTNLRPGAEDAT